MFHRLPQLSVDSEFTTALLDEISSYASRKNLDRRNRDLAEERPVKAKVQRELDWCFDLRRFMVKKKNREGEVITSSGQLADEITSYCNEHMTGHFMKFQTSHVLRKRLLKVIKKQLPRALIRELRARDAFIRDSRDTQQLADLLLKNTDLEDTLKEVHRILEQRDIEVFEKETALRLLRRTNRELEKKIFMLQESVRVIPSLTEKIEALERRLVAVEQKRTSRVISQSLFGSVSRSHVVDDGFSDLSGLSGRSFCMDEFTD